MARMNYWRLAILTARGLLIGAVAILGTNLLLDYLATTGVFKSTVIGQFVLLAVTLLAIGAAASPIVRYVKEHEQETHLDE